MSYKWWTTGEIEAVRRLVGERKSRLEIAEALGRSEQSISGVMYRIRVRSRNRTTEKDRERFEELRKAGLTYDHIAAMCGFKRGTVANYFSRRSQ